MRTYSATFKWHCNNTIKIPVCDLHLKEIYDLVVRSCSLNVTWGVTSFVCVRRTWKQKQFGYSLSYWAYFYLILRLVIKCETTAIVRLWSHSSLEDFVTRDKIVSCLMSVWWSWIENDSDIGLTNDSDIGLTNPDNGFLKKKKKKKKQQQQQQQQQQQLYWRTLLRVATSDAKSCLLSMGALSTTMY